MRLKQNQKKNNIESVNLWRIAKHTQNPCIPIHRRSTESQFSRITPIEEHNEQRDLLFRQIFRRRVRIPVSAHLCY